ncbi:LytTR family DNA-binding domain-containing protein [Fulvivirga ulvae]|uniref:LytR/AlgR family response regulator transcription factor n=1 Tax=Fulvivirga ulvae TaxID=2904245 RepID=UPI001F42D44A|nr:LytTR family DNA-binding domain-containing protein [Fulvivirga ulvae]UII31054.1 LytTR family DNA-binding domain-containing protein [Fulvivirga ulvae]
MIKAIAIDDEPLPLQVVDGFCAKCSFVNLQNTFTSTLEAKRFLAEHDIDLIFLDIQMPAITGIDFFKGLDQQLMVIFTTAYSQYAVEGFNLNAIDYLLKPYDFTRFMQAVNKAREYMTFRQQGKDKEQSEIFIRADYSVVKIQLNDILFVEGLADYIRIHLDNSRPVVTRMPMKTILNELGDGFLRVHRSYIVPLGKIEKVRNKTIFIKDKEIPIGKTYKAVFDLRFDSK